MAQASTALGALDGAPNQQLSARDPQEERLAWWRQARFGLFIHWGLYAVAAGEWNGAPTTGAGEWIMNDKQIPLSQYAKLVPQFNPVKFDASQWVAIAKAAGMKYIVITSKHHEGFGMFPSELTDWCIKSTPFHRDPLKELAEACRQQGIKLCFYYSIMDWHHPDYAPRKPWNDIASNPPDFDRYVQFMKGQLAELVHSYHPSLLWFDGQWEKTWTYDRGVDLCNYVRALDPRVIVNNRVGSEQAPPPGRPRAGDYLTPEQTIPPNGFGPGIDWETCMTMNDTWGFKQSDNDWKSPRTLIHNLIDCASKGGNYLLNVGPTPEGLIPEPSVDRLRLVGQWMQINGSAIYGTAASPFGRPFAWGRCTAKVDGRATTLYLHVFDWPSDGQLVVPGLKNKPQAIYLLSDARKHMLPSHLAESGLAIALPAAPPEADSSTIVLRINGPLAIEPVLITQMSDGSIHLPASEAALHGATLQYESGGPLDNIGYWTNPDDWADWDFKAVRPGQFKVLAEIAAPAESSFDIELGQQKLTCAAPLTGSYRIFKTVELGVLNLPTAGKATLAVRPAKGHWQAINLKAITLQPLRAK